MAQYSKHNLLVSSEILSLFQHRIISCKLSFISGIFIMVISSAMTSYFKIYSIMFYTEAEDWSSFMELLNEYYSNYYEDPLTDIPKKYQRPTEEEIKEEEDHLSAIQGLVDSLKKLVRVVCC